MDSVKKNTYLKDLKLKGSSLVETLLATVIILIVFGIAMTTVMNVLERTIKTDTSKIDSELNKMTYQYHHGFIKVPSEEKIGLWNVEISRELKANVAYVIFKASHAKSKDVRMKKELER